MLNIEPLPSVAADDPSITECLVELDQKMAAWLSAVSQAQSVLLARAEKSAVDRDAQPQVASQADQPEREDARPAQVLPTSDGQAHTEAKQRAESETDRGVEKLDDQVECESLDPSVADTAAVAETVEDQQVSEREDQLSQKEEDERLLATLDADTQKEIRVRRRLFDQKPRVRELLAEIESEKLARAQAEGPESKRSLSRKRKR